jgi:hypothetical protein
MVGSDRNGDNLLHASSAGRGKDSFQETAKNANEAQFDSHPLLSRQPKVGVSLSESE